MTNNIEEYLVQITGQVGQNYAGKAMNSRYQNNP
jgi:hypothetical protein